MFQKVLLLLDLETIVESTFLLDSPLMMEFNQDFIDTTFSTRLGLIQESLVAVTHPMETYVVLLTDSKLTRLDLGTFLKFKDKNPLLNLLNVDL